MPNEVLDSHPALAQREPGVSLHPMLREKAIGIARVQPAKNIRFSDSWPDIDVLERLAKGLRRMDGPNGVGTDG